MTAGTADTRHPDAPEGARAILDFWFGPLTADGMPEQDRMARWFSPDAEFDAAVRERFGRDLEQVERLEAWEAHPGGTLALVLLTDQFPRNLHRGTAAAFAWDVHARAILRRALERGDAARLAPIECAFLFMPLQHAEEPGLQDESVRRFRALATAADPAVQPLFASFAEHAENHRAVITEFGRFPHRNAVLGRAATAAERRWLASGGSTWGQGGG